MNRKVIITLSILAVSILTIALIVYFLMPINKETVLSDTTEITEETTNLENYTNTVGETSSINVNVNEKSPDLLVLSSDYFESESESTSIDSLPIFDENKLQTSGSTTSESNNKNIINFGEPDIQLGNEAEKVPISNQQDILTLEDTIEKDTTEKNTTTSTKENVSSNSKIVKLRKTVDKTNTYPLIAIALLGFAVMLKVILGRNLHE